MSLGHVTAFVASAVMVVLGVFLMLKLTACNGGTDPLAVCKQSNYNAREFGEYEYRPLGLALCLIGLIFALIVSRHDQRR